ncbi:MAG: hypothetical protein L6R42_001950 [Xanthoria sp. 1 TBL-2021]|nr:MAG: hypothetical protein L6R42_001950 [Xanthoria sp. 1 TBL-2021]
MLSSRCGTTPDHAPQKLSKPPTNTLSSNLLAPTRQKPEPVSPLTVSDDSADGYFPNMPAQGERRERQNTRSKIRSYLYGPSPESGHSHSSDDDESSPRRFADVVKRRLSRTDSAISQSLTVGAASAASSTSRLHLADTSSSDEHDAVKEQIREKVWIDTLAAQNHVSTPIDEDKHPDSVMSPIRRRSLYTPGIATRSPEDILRKPPPPEQIRSRADRDYYYNPALPDFSPLSRLANLRSPQNGRSTPSELDYSHLGALQLGTLRVTNGTASPAPREQDTSLAPTPALDTTSYDGLYEPSDGGRSEPDGSLTMGDLMKDSLPRSHDSSHGTAASPAEAPMYAAARPSYITPDREVHARHGSRTGSFASIQSLTTGHKPIKRKPLPEASSAGCHEMSCSGTARPMSEFYSDHYLIENRAYLGRNMPATPTVQTDNIEHKNFGPMSNQELQPESWRSSIPGADQLPRNKGSREDAFLKLTRNQTVRDELGGVDDTHQNPPHESHFDKQHVDSGYSSNISLESTQMPTSKVALDSTAPSDGPALLHSSCPHLLQTPRESKPMRCSQGSNESHKDTELNPDTQYSSNKQKRPIANEETERSPLSIGPDHLVIQKQPPSPEKPRRLQKKRPKSQPPLHRTPMLSDSLLSSTNIPPVPTGIAALHSERVARLPPNNHTYANLQHIEAYDMPENLTSMTAQTRFPSPMHGSANSLPRDRPSVFQKLASKARSRSRSRPRVTKSPYHSDDEPAKSDIMRSPSWSDYGNKKKTEQREKARSRSRPRAMQSPCHTDDESAKSDIMRSPSWSEYGNKKKTEQRRKAKAEREVQKQMKRESSCDPEARSRSKSKSRSRSRFRSRSRKRSSQGEPVPTLTDFGTVSESLGAGLYDIAMASHAPNHQSPRNQLQLQPHQINTTKSRVDPKAAISMSPFERGRHRSHTSATVPLSEGIYVSTGALPKPDRPRSMYFESRPIPAMAMADLTQRRSILPRTNGQVLTSDAKKINTAQQVSSTTLSLASNAGYEAVSNSSVEPEKESQSAPTTSKALTTDKNDTMEELIDKLLEAPSHEAREILLEQMRQVRQKPMVESKAASQQANRSTNSSSQEDAKGALSPSTPSVGTSQQRFRTTETGESKAVKATAKDHIRHHSMFVNAPPIPPLPRAEDLHEQETQRSMEQSRRSKTLVAPQTPALEPTKTDLWAGCAIQTEHRKAIESCSGWDAHRLAWSSRRKSAGEALLVQNRPSGMMSPMSSGDMSREVEGPPSTSRAMTASIEQPAVAKDSQKAFHRPWALSQGQVACEGDPTGGLQSSSKVAAATQTFERRSGRYEGGLLFGYEKGFGLGGSAGTRSTTKTGATRKSLQMSQGFGVDLSDVPIFVAPSK